VLIIALPLARAGYARAMSTESGEARPWPLPLQLAFRFVFAWLMIIIAPFPLGSFPGAHLIAKLIHAIFAPLFGTMR
jgi:hypothetical protein